MLTIFCRCWLLLQMHFNERYPNICWQNTCSGHSWESTPWPRNCYSSYPWTFSPSRRSDHSLRFINFLGKVFLSLGSHGSPQNLVPKFDSSPQCQFSLNSSPEDTCEVLFQTVPGPNPLVPVSVMINSILLQLEPALAQVLFPSATGCCESACEVGICLALLCFFKILESWCVYCLLTLGLQACSPPMTFCPWVSLYVNSSATTLNGLGSRVVSNGFQFRELSFWIHSAPRLLAPKGLLLARVRHDLIFRWASSKQQMVRIYVRVLLSLSPCSHWV